MDYTIHTIAERPDLTRARLRVTDAAWPPFMQHDPMAGRYYDRLDTDFPACQFMLLGTPGTVIALGFTIPFYWDGTPAGLPAGWDAVLEQGMQDHDAGRVPNTLSALEATIHPDYRRQGLSRVIIKQMRAIAAAHGFGALVAPVRPNQKSLYPLTAIERYAAWTRPDGAPFDAWIRTHWRLGARILQPAPQSMHIPGTVAQWEEWTGLTFPDSGSYVVPQALSPITIDRAADQGVYVEPNVWMLHAVGGET